MSIVNILLVDDDEDDYILTRDILREIYTNQEYKLSWCNNFSEAINAMLKSHYDVYLVDYRLGRESGLELLNEAVKSNCTEPIIILTGKGDIKIDREAMRCGAADYLVKDNINGQTLERSIRYAIAQNTIFQQLKNSEKKFRILFERSKDPMLITTSKGLILEANKAAVEFFETTLTDLQKINAADLYKHQEDREIYIKEMIDGGSIKDHEVDLLTRAKKSKFCSISSFMQVSQHANEELYYSIIHDLTYRQQQEKDSFLGEKLETTERIAKNLSIEIQNPLSNVNLAIDELSDVLQNEDHLMLVDIIKSNCEKINALTAELIESTEATAIQLADTNLTAILVELIAEAKENLDLTIKSQWSNSELIIQADEQNLKQALSSIIQNSIEAGSSKNPEISISVEIRSSFIKLNITDNGEGISKENLPKVFDPFFTTKSKAAGLGLTRAQRILNSHNGKLHISSEYGIGTKISITLPYNLT